MEAIEKKLTDGLAAWAQVQHHCSRWLWDVDADANAGAASSHADERAGPLVEQGV